MLTSSPRPSTAIIHRRHPIHHLNRGNDETQDMGGRGGDVVERDSLYSAFET